MLFPARRLARTGRLQGFALAFKGACTSGLAVGAGIAALAPVAAVAPIAAIAVTRVALAFDLRLGRACLHALRLAVQLQVWQRCNQCCGVGRFACQ